MSDIDLIFGINADSLVFGRNIANVDGNMLVYVDSVIREDYETSIRDLGGLTFSDNEAVRATRLFLQNIRVMPNKTRLRLYALSGEYDRNLEYAQKMSNSLMEEGILPDQTELVLLGTDEMTAANRDSNPNAELIDEKGSLRRWVDMFINLMQDEWQKS